MKPTPQFCLYIKNNKNITLKIYNNKISTYCVQIYIFTIKK